jgi:hypothetical protein
MSLSPWQSGGPGHIFGKVVYAHTLAHGLIQYLLPDSLQEEMVGAKVLEVAHLTPAKVKCWGSDPALVAVYEKLQASPKQGKFAVVEVVCKEFKQLFSPGYNPETEQYDGDPEPETTTASADGVYPAMFVYGPYEIVHIQVNERKPARAPEDAATFDMLGLGALVEVPTPAVQPRTARAREPIGMPSQRARAGNVPF